MRHWVEQLDYEFSMILYICYNTLYRRNRKMILMENNSELALDNFQEPTINRELSQERKERPNKHGNP